MTGESIEILLVEDNPADVRLFHEALKERTVAVRLSVAPDGVEAVAFLPREHRYAMAPRPDLILLDINLPRTSGHEVLGQIKSDPELRRIPVVVLTTSRAESDVERSYDLHANCYIVKSSDLDRLFQTMSLLEDFWLGVVQRPSHPLVRPHAHRL